jgi:hypothetical protein
MNLSLNPEGGSRVEGGELTAGFLPFSQQQPCPHYRHTYTLIPTHKHAFVTEGNACKHHKASA